MTSLSQKEIDRTPRNTESAREGIEVSSQALLTHAQPHDMSEILQKLQMHRLSAQWRAEENIKLQQQLQDINLVHRDQLNSLQSSHKVRCIDVHVLQKKISFMNTSKAS